MIHTEFLGNSVKMCAAVTVLTSKEGACNERKIILY